ncbi:MAG: DUF1289 domain-containing protein [Pseudomonadota bacterium]
MSATVPNSPCISLCSIGPRGWCAGCYRTLEEIAGWMRLEPAARLAVLRACDARRKVEAPGADGP